MLVKVLAPIHHKILKTHSLKKVVAVVRHGSRSPCQGGVECWPGYQPTLEWGCGVDSLEAPALPGRDFQRMGKTLYLKISEAEPVGFLPGERWSQETNGLCYLGQLLPEGFEQHQSNGRALRAAYVGSGAEVGTLVGEGEVLGDQDLFLRSSDLPRTVASGQALLSAFLGGAGDAAALTDAQCRQRFPRGVL